MKFTSMASAMLLATATAQLCEECIEIARITNEIFTESVQGSLMDLEGLKWKNTLDMVDGFLIGALEMEHVYDVEVCIEDLTPLASEVETIFDDFSNGSFSKIADGLEHLGTFVHELRSSLDQCEHIHSADMHKLQQMGDIFLHPKQLFINLGKNVLVNGIEIYHLIK